MASRATRGMASLQDAIEKLSVREKLLLSQAIYECGSAKWDEVSKMIVSHPLTERPNAFFSPTNCHAMYNHLMRDVGFGPTNPPPGDTAAPKGDAHKAMAYHYYQQHVQDLKAAIAAEEARFKTLTTEIEEINAGKWDEKILSELNPMGANDGFARPSASPLPRHLTLDTGELSQRGGPDSPLDGIRANSPAGGRSTRDGTPVDASTPRTIPGSPAGTNRSRPWNSKDNKRVREMKERRARELERRSSLVPDTSEATDEAPPDTPVTDTPPTPVVGPASSTEVAETPTSVAVPESSAEAEAVTSERPQAGDVTTTPSAGTDAPAEAREEVVESSQPNEDSKGGKIKRRASDVSMADALPDPKRARQEDTEMQDASTSAPTQSPEPSTSTSASLANRHSAAPTPAATPAPVAIPPTNKKFQNVISLVHQQIYQHRGGNIFHNPIKKSEAPDYYEIVRRPMDLKTVKSRIKDGVISSADHFKRDVFLMFANAIMYNRPGTSVNDIAAEMMIESERHIADFRAAEEFNKPARG